GGPVHPNRTLTQLQRVLPRGRHRLGSSRETHLTPCHPSPHLGGTSLLRYLRELYLKAQAVNVHWLLLGQLAQAVRDPGLLDEVTALHKETLTQIKRLKTRLKDIPQVLATGG
ncbi:MAG: hypothetical protein JF597_44080, partial [Streptomyces sp.]|nr:hypothetical protein [Streptomyces sp.]